MRLTGPIARAHPEHEGYRRKWFKSPPARKCLYERYRFCNKYIKGKTVLDIPCGVGWGTSLLKGARRVHGVDLSDEAIEYARSHFGRRACFSMGNMNELSFSDDSFDVIICLEGLEHVEPAIARAFLQEARRVLKAGGLFIATAPLLTDGRHSGNPYHIHEFEMKEAEEMLCDHFRTIMLEQFEGPGAREIRFVGENVKPRASLDE